MIQMIISSMPHILVATFHTKVCPDSTAGAKSPNKPSRITPIPTITSKILVKQPSRLIL